MQLVPFKGHTKLINFWDGGANIVLMRYEFAKKSGLKGRRSLRKYKAYWVTMVDRAMGINTITSAIFSVSISGVIHLLKDPV